LYDGIRDVSELSWRRIWALATLTIREAVRRKALLVFVIFGVLFMFGSWFLTSADEKADIQIERHVVFVFTAVSWLVLPVILMLACWESPRHQGPLDAYGGHQAGASYRGVLGRMLGFSLVATVIVALMESSVISGSTVRSRGTSMTGWCARFRIYGRLSFLDRQGEPTKSGINVGDVWTFRSYIEGSTKGVGHLGISIILASPR